jgi:4-hydroxybenzoate polyprenyltransferase
MSRKELALPEHTGSTIPWYRRTDNRLVQAGDRLWTVLVSSSLYITLIAMAEVAIVMALLSLPMGPAPFVVGLVTFAVYTNDRITDVDTDAISNPRQARFVLRHKRPLYVLAAVAYGVAVALSLLGGPVALLLTLIPGVFWAVYALDVGENVGIGVRRLKDVLIVNSTVVALAWALTLTFLPLAFAGRAITPAVVVVFLYFFLRAVTDTEIPNIADVEADREIGVSTIPVMFGIPRTRQFLYAIDALAAALVGYAVYAGYLPLVYGLALGAGLCYSVMLVRTLGRWEMDAVLAKASEWEYLVTLAVIGSVTLLV